DEALEAAREAMKDPNSECSKLFSSSGKNGLEELNKLIKKGKIKIKDTSVAKYLSSNGRLSGNPNLQAVTKGGTVYINTAGTVFRGTYATIVNGVYRDPTHLFDGFSPLQVLAATIIHELLHVTGSLEPE